ncbi:MAG TPA: hypothetical protein VFZ26_16815 [Gemmatimonadales bacterium]
MRSRFPRLRGTLTSAILAAALGCDHQSDSPTAPEPDRPALATAATGLVFQQLSGGYDHTCGVTADQRAYCWGYNGLGQLGDGTTTQRLTPVPVAGDLRFRQISAGSFVTCGVTTSDRVYCWGSNEIGQLGDGTTTRRLTPVRVAGSRYYRQVETNASHTCAVTPERRAFCWGDNRRGALGNGNNTGPEVGRYGAFSSRPVAVVGSHAFRQVTAGFDHTCGVTTGDDAYCWGSNARGQLGDSTEVRRRTSPVRVAGGRAYRQLDAGNDFTCGVTLGDRAFCWGNGRQGQLGNGKLYYSFWPRAVAGGLRFTRVTGSYVHACAEARSDQVYCWGTNYVGQLGDGTTTTSLKPVAVAGGLLFAQVSAGFAHNCGRTAEGAGYCWGLNSNGQLGNGTTQLSTMPVPVGGGT